MHPLVLGSDSHSTLANSQHSSTSMLAGHSQTHAVKKGAGVTHSISSTHGSVTPVGKPVAAVSQTLQLTSPVRVPPSSIVDSSLHPASSEHMESKQLYSTIGVTANAMPRLGTAPITTSSSLGAVATGQHGTTESHINDEVIPGYSKRCDGIERCWLR